MMFSVSKPQRHKPAYALSADEWMVETLSLAQAQELVAREHYARGTSNTATFRHGLFRREEWPFFYRGAALWIPPTKGAALNSTNGDWQRVLTLSRLAIEPDVPTNGASFLIGRSIRLIRAEGSWDVLTTYADEAQGHTGAIYLACGFEFVGYTQPERIYYIGGRMVSRKAGPKTRTHDEMLALGAECVGTSRKRKFVKVLRG